VTTINIQRFAEQPRTNLEGIPPEFIAWANAVHGWNEAALLEIGRAAGACGNALDELVTHYLRLSGGGKQCCCCCVESAPYSTYGGLLDYCEEEFPIYAENDLAKYMRDDELTAAGLLRQSRCYIGINQVA
jgi:hypothetical protein